MAEPTEKPDLSRHALFDGVALEALGAQIEVSEGYVDARAPAGGLIGGEIDLPFASVGATEHAMLAAALARGETVIENAAREPEIADLAAMLTAMGALVEGAGSSTIRIQGRTKLSGVRHHVVGDRIETATYALAVAATGGDCVLQGANWSHNKALWRAMIDAGVTVEPADEGVRVARNGSRLTAVDIETQPYPGFPTDAQAQFMAVMTLAEGTSVIRENIFENRFMHAPELTRLGADISVHGNEAVVRGVEKLRGAPVMATDLRASVSLVIAGLAAEGETVVNRVYHLDRGFERLEAKLSGCGARIERRAD